MDTVINHIAAFYLIAFGLLLLGTFPNATDKRGCVVLCAEEAAMLCLRCLTLTFRIPYYAVLLVRSWVGR